MKELTEIRWHGRGGQGAKTAALLLGEAVLKEGKYIQAFPEYGPERMGAPVQSFNRISNNPITLHCGISQPDIVIVLDVSLMGKIDVTAGLQEGGILIINTFLHPKEIKEKNKLKGYKICTVDASSIAKKTIGREIPNTPMLGALIKVTNLLKLETILLDIEKKLEKKFKNQPDVIKGNMEAITKAYKEVKIENE